MSVFEHRDYKKAIRQRTKSLKIKDPGLSLRAIADAVPMQYTFLSRVLNREDTHLSEDQLYSIAQKLRLNDDEMEYLFLLRSYQTTSSTSRRDLLSRKLDKIQRRNVSSSVIHRIDEKQNEGELKYLLEPLHLFVHMGLQISRLKQNPHLLAHLLGVTESEIKHRINHLEQIGFVERAKGSGEIRKVKQEPIHFSSDHPVVRAGQALLRTLGDAQLLKTSEENKKTVQAVFTADEISFEKMKAELRKFVSSIESIAVNSQSRHLFQINLDLFRWF